MLCVLCVFGSPAQADIAFRQRMQALEQQLRARPEAEISLLVVSLEDSSKALLAVDETRALTPASVAKVITSAAALQNLGPEYRFPTEVFVDRLPREEHIGLNTSGGLAADVEKWSAGSLYIRGYGDPTMIDERLWELARTVLRHGVQEVQDVIIDPSLFKNPPAALGENSYEAPLSATSLNHNCYALHILPRGVGMKPHWVLSEGAAYSLQMLARTTRSKSELSVSQIPASMSFVPEQVFRKLPEGLLIAGEELRLTVQGGIPHGSELETIYRPVPFPPSYFAQALKTFLVQHGVRVKGRLIVGATPRSAKRLFLFESRPLHEILTDLNYYSNNFIAGQIQYALGQEASGYFDRGKGLEAISAVLTEKGFTKGQFVLNDASGLDRSNRLSAEQLVRVLVDAYQDFGTYPQLISSLSRFGASGTLEDRSLLTAEEEERRLKFEREGLRRRATSVWGKTGTLTGVSSLAGYLELETGERAAFASLINGISKAEAVEIEHRVLKELIGNREPELSSFGERK